MKPPKFDGTQDPIVAMRWISNVEIYFYTCSFPENLRVHFALNLLLLGAKDWWKFVTIDYTLAERSMVTRKRFTEIFRYDFVPVVVRERLDQELLSLKQKTKMVTEIMRTFHEWAMFCPKHVSINQA